MDLHSVCLEHGGIDTIKRLHESGGRCLALAAGDVIMLDKPYMLDLADEMGVAVVGVPIGASRRHARREDTDAKPDAAPAAET